MLLLDGSLVNGAARDSLRVSNFKIYRVKDTLQVAFELCAKGSPIEQCKGLTVQPYIVGETKSIKLKPLVVKDKKRSSWYSFFRKSKPKLLQGAIDNNISMSYLGSVKLEEWMTKRSWLEVESISDKDFVVFMDRSKSIIDVKNNKETEVSVGLLATQVSNKHGVDQIPTGLKREEFDVKPQSASQSNGVSGTSLTSSSSNYTVSNSTIAVAKPDYSRFPFIVESSKLPDEYYRYDYLSEFGLPLYYEFNDLGLNDYYKNNFVSLTKLYESLRKILVKDRQKIKKVVIAGYSSPEGYTVINEDIAKRRGDVLKDRLCKVIGINPDIVEVVNGGENWSGLKSLVEKSSLKDKEDLLNIINYKIVLKEFNRVEDPINSDRERKMLDLNYSNSYQQIRTQYFPMIRIAYVLIVY